MKKRYTVWNKSELIVWCLVLLFLKYGMFVRWWLDEIRILFIEQESICMVYVYMYVCIWTSIYLYMVYTWRMCVCIECLYEYTYMYMVCTCVCMSIYLYVYTSVLTVMHYSVYVCVNRWAVGVKGQIAGPTQSSVYILVAPPAAGPARGHRNIELGR